MSCKCVLGASTCEAGAFVPTSAGKAFRPEHGIRNSIQTSLPLWALRRNFPGSKPPIFNYQYSSGLVKPLETTNYDLRLLFKRGRTRFREQNGVKHIKAHDLIKEQDEQKRPHHSVKKPQPYSRKAKSASSSARSEKIRHAREERTATLSSCQDGSDDSSTGAAGPEFLSGGVFTPVSLSFRQEPCTPHLGPDSSLTLGLQRTFKGTSTQPFSFKGHLAYQ